jgi:hypothetical protein
MLAVKYCLSHISLYSIKLPSSLLDLNICQSTLVINLKFKDSMNRVERPLFASDLRLPTPVRRGWGFESLGTFHADVYQ